MKAAGRTVRVSPVGTGKAKSVATSLSKEKPTPPRRERVLVEFPTSLLKRTDAAARSMEKNRSELIRDAVEQLLGRMESRKFEQDLADAYIANSPMNEALSEEFAHIDAEGF